MPLHNKFRDTKKQMNILLVLKEQQYVFEMELQKMLRYYRATKFHFKIKMYCKGSN